MRESPTARLSRAIRVTSAGAPPLADTDLPIIAQALAANQPPLRPPQLLLDVSELSKADARTGIQRVVRNVIHHLTAMPATGMRAELVIARNDVQYARTFAAKHFGLPPLGPDEYASLAPGDIFLGLDLNAQIAPSTFDLLRRRNVRLYFVVYDLLPLLRPSLFTPGMPPVFFRWLAALSANADGLVCISRAVADELYGWLDGNAAPRSRPLKIGYFPLGSDLDGGRTVAASVEEQATVAEATARKAVLMAGTIEPRKGHEQALAAFELLWNRGVDVSLIIAGRPGWLVEPLLERLNNHRELGKRLFWFKQASDELLGLLYRSASLLLSASLGEGFGLPVIEASQHGMPLLLRDIPVFREVAGDCASYFSGMAPSDIADAVVAWLERAALGQVQSSAGIKAISWEESARRLLAVIEHGPWYREWLPPAAAP
jgi:glycosyltransferase involved in cell wall biosynthesis